MADHRDYSYQQDHQQDHAAPHFYLSTFDPQLALHVMRQVAENAASSQAAMVEWMRNREAA